MLQIPCPWCGIRDESEFSYGGESGVIRPSPEIDDSGWSRYLFVRVNPKGISHERLFHAFGCRQWFNVVRDTVTHEIHTTYRIGEDAAKARTQP